MIREKPDIFMPGFLLRSGSGRIRSSLTEMARRAYDMNVRSYDIYKRCDCEATRKPEAVKSYPVITKQLKMASVPSKLKILLLLAEAPHCVCDLVAHTKLSQTLISHHLSDFAGTNLVKSEKSGAFVDYSLTKKGRKLITAIQTLTP